MSERIPAARFAWTSSARQMRSSSRRVVTSLTSAAVSIETLVIEDLEDAVREALRGGLRPKLLDDFLATVDWSNQESAPQAIRETLGMLEQSATEFAEDDLAEADYRSRLLSFLPAADRLQPATSD